MLLLLSLLLLLLFVCHQYMDKYENEKVTLKSEEPVWFFFLETHHWEAIDA